MSTALPVFTADQRERAHALLALQVTRMMGRKLEEADWTDVYTAALGIPQTGWSNLDIDVVHGNLGVEQKALRAPEGSIETVAGKTMMHPALTRAFRINSAQSDANAEMRSVLTQYAEIVERRRARVASQNRTGLEVDLRMGWLLWQPSLREFLYFEEPMTTPDPDNYYAEWREGPRSTGARKSSRNLWIYERQTGRKRYSVTTDAGAKIQPYFDIPDASDPNLYTFKVIGEGIGNAEVRLWLAPRTADELQLAAGGLEKERIDDTIRAAAEELDEQPGGDLEIPSDQAIPVVVSAESYQRLVEAIPDVNDDQRVQQLLRLLVARNR